MESLAVSKSIGQVDSRWAPSNNSLFFMTLIIIDYEGLTFNLFERSLKFAIVFIYELYKLGFIISLQRYVVKNNSVGE